MSSIADSASEVSGGVTSGAVARAQHDETAKPLNGGSKKRGSKTSKRRSRKSKSMKKRNTKSRKTSKK
jgi:hypothetical protein